MHFTSETSSDGVVERGFTLDNITGVLWSPAADHDGAALVLLGHGGGLHKKAAGLVARAHHCVRTCGFTVAAIDAPGHGDRARNEQDRRWVTALRQARNTGEPIGPVVVDYNRSLAERAVPEWQATLDALQMLPEIGTAAPVGYGGMTLASSIGLPLTANDSRITAAVLGGVFAYDDLIEAARRITVPIEFLLPWDDAEIDRRSGLELFDAFASTDKTLLGFPGGHHETPWSVADDTTHFYARHLAFARPA